MKRIVLVVGCLFVLFPAREVVAQTSYFSVANGAWHETSTWTNSSGLAGIPGADDIIHVRNALTITQHVQVGSLNITTGSLNIAQAQSLMFSPGRTGHWSQATIGGGGSFINQGTLFVAGTTTELAAAHMTNAGIMQVHADSVQINGTLLNSTEGIVSFGGERYALTSDPPSKIFGAGQLVNAGTLALYTNRMCSVSVYNSGSMTLGTGSTFIASGNMVHSNGSISLATGSVFRVTGGTNHVYGSLNLQGPGSMNMTTGQLSFFRMGQMTGTYLNTGPGGFHWEGGTIAANMPDGQLVNRGDIIIGSYHARTNDPIPLLQGTLVNEGTIDMRATTGVALNVVGTFSNAPSGQFTFASSNGIIQGFGPSQFHNNGQVTFTGGGTSSVNMVYFQHGGTTTFHQGWASIYGEMYGGHLALNGGTWVGGVSWFMSGGSIGGSGQIANNVHQNSGSMSPGSSAGLLEIDGFFLQQGEEPELLMEVGGSDPGTEYDQIVVSSSGTVSGVLTVDLLDSYSPPIGSQFNLLLAQEVQGRFAATNLPVLPADRAWTVDYASTGIFLRVETYTPPEGTGTVTCIIDPPGARTDNAAWRVTSGPNTDWQASGATLTIPSGVYTMEFSQVSGWSSPDSQTSVVLPDATTTNTATYACSLMTAPASFNFPAAVSTGTVTITIGSGCPWVASRDADWIVFTSPTNGAGSGSVTFSVLENEGDARTGNIRVNNEATIPVRQSGTEERFGLGWLMLLFQ